MKSMTRMDEYIGAVETAVEHIAYIRRMAELCDADMKEFDEALDALCSEKHAKFEKMNEVQIAVYGLMDIIHSGHGEELLSDMMNSEKGE